MKKKRTGLKERVKGEPNVDEVGRLHCQASLRKWPVSWSLGISGN